MTAPANALTLADYVEHAETFFAETVGLDHRLVQNPAQA